LKKILITGGSGLLASNWAQVIKNQFHVTLLMHRMKISTTGIETTSDSVGSLDEINALINKHKPDLIIHAAGLTNIEQCEFDKISSEEVNVNFSENISKACFANKVKLVFISTDHLFSGKKQFYSEQSATEPLNQYAITKLEGEKRVLKHNPSALIIRTNFFGWGPKHRDSFSDKIIDSLRNNKPIKLFADVFFTPILVDELVIKVHELVSINASGVFNVVGSERISKYKFGVSLSRAFNLDSSLIIESSFDDATSLVLRPKDMSLDNSKLNKLKLSPIKDLQEQFLYMKEIENSRKISFGEVVLIPYGRHFIDDLDIKAVTDVLKNGMLTQGPKVTEFENNIAKFVGAKYAVAVSSGTAALHLSSIVLNLQQGDEVITSPNTFVATSNAILYVGAKPVFVDIDKETLNLDINDVEKILLKPNRVKAIFPVHFAGSPCDMKKLVRIARKYKLRILEDASHALGAMYDSNNRVGNCKYSDLTVFSFHPVKGIAAGEGGVITTNDEALYRRLTLLRSHGITKGNFEFPGISKSDNSLIKKEEAIEEGELKRWYYEMQHLGFNYRITDIQCALANSQLSKIDIFLERRREIVAFYDEAFMNIKNIILPQVQNRVNSSHHIYPVLINFKQTSFSRQQLMKKLAELGIGTQVHYIPVPSQPFYESLGYTMSKLDNSFYYYKHALTLPLFYGLSDNEIEFIAESLVTIVQ